MWSTSTYAARAATKKAAGQTAFHYSDTALRTVPRDQLKAHDLLDPKSVNKAGAHDGQNIREAYDNSEHPESLAIAVLFDVTGSMGRIPQVLQQKLPDLHGLLMRKSYVTDPQILFGAIGDANTDRVPLQIGQFEADNRMDEQLENILLEGGGGGQVHESYELGLYYMARHTDLDCLNKRGKKGYLFLMGDEMPYGTVSREQVKKHIGDDLAEDIPVSDIVAELEEKFEVFFLFVSQGAYEASRIMPAWQELLGERVLILDDADAVCETIALTLGLLEGITDLENGVGDLTDISNDAKAAAAAGKALSGIGK